MIANQLTTPERQHNSLRNRVELYVGLNAPKRLSTDALKQILTIIENDNE